MDSLFQKFSIQHFLRQFFCGVVFFVPIYLFSRDEIGTVCHVEKWETGTFLLFASLASIIGTIIYHLEKNLYSYPLMYLYTRYFFKNATDNTVDIPPKLRWGWVILLFLCFAFLFVLKCVNLLPCGTGGSWCTWCSCCVLFILTLVGLLIVSACVLGSDVKLIINPTLEMWKVEYSAKVSENIEAVPSEKNDESCLQKAAVEKLAKWSDFIHCGQSCCFAWILGSLISYEITGSCERVFWIGIVVSVCILAAEMVVDMHRYRFVSLIQIKKDFR